MMDAATALRLLLLWLIVTLGVFRPQAGSAQIVRSGPPSCPGVALTFDLCPVRKEAGYDDALVGYLTQHQIPATFFLSGQWIAKHGEAVEDLLKIEFFEIGTHGEVHAHLPMHNVTEQREEIRRPVALLQDHYARKATLFRPPYGEYDDLTVNVVKALGLRFIQWSIESGDPDPRLTSDQILGKLSKRVRPGSIIVFHANGKGRQTRQVIERLTTDVLPSKGLRPMTVSELLACKQPPP
jgi:peptidoglycan-N-acetylglucosamine deacetylase